MALWLFPVAGLLFEKLDADVTDNGVMTAGICGVELVVLLLKELYRCRVTEGYAQEKRDHQAPMSLLYNLEAGKPVYCITLYDQRVSQLKIIAAGDFHHSVVELVQDVDIQSLKGLELDVLYQDKGKRQSHE